MKKYLLSFLVIATFGLYGLFQHISGNSENTADSFGENQNLTTATTPTSQNNPQTPPTASIPKVVKQTRQFKDGTYTGVSANAYYGDVQVAAVIKNGKISDVQILNYPQDRDTSRRINGQALPILQTEAIQAQNSNVNVVSGATDSSGAFITSLGSALAQAKNS